MQVGTAHYASALGCLSSLLPALPALPALPKHDPNVETIAAGTAGLKAAIMNGAELHRASVAGWATLSDQVTRFRCAVFARILLSTRLALVAYFAYCIAGPDCLARGLAAHVSSPSSRACSRNRGWGLLQHLQQRVRLRLQVVTYTARSASWPDLAQQQHWLARLGLVVI